MGWMKGMTSTDQSMRRAVRSRLRVLLLSAAVVGSLLTVYVAGYVVLRSQEIVTDEAQHGSSFDNRAWVKGVNWLAMPGYAVELQWRFRRMPERWQRCIDAGLCPEGERRYDQVWAQFWYRQGYLDAIPDAMMSAICGATSFTTPGFRGPSGAYFHGAIDGERIVQVVIQRHMVEHGFDWKLRGRIQPSPSREDWESGQVQFEGNSAEHARLQQALDALRVKFGLAPQMSTSSPAP